MDKNLLIRFFEGQATTDEEMKVRKWMEASTENRRTYFKERKMYDMTLLLSKDTKKLFHSLQKRSLNLGNL